MAITEKIHGIDWANIKVDLIPQITEKFCWAACVQMIDFYYNISKNVYIDGKIKSNHSIFQNKIGSFYRQYNRVSEKIADKTPSVFLKNDPEHFIKVLSWVSLESAANSLIDIKTIKQNIMDFKPILMIKKITGGFVNHAMVITGWEKIDENSIYLIINDPLETKGQDLIFAKKASKYKMRFKSKLESKFWESAYFVLLDTPISGKINNHPIGNISIQQRVGNISNNLNKAINKQDENINKSALRSANEDTDEKNQNNLVEIQQQDESPKQQIEQANTTLLENENNKVEIARPQSGKQIDLNPKVIFELKIESIEEINAKLKTSDKTLAGLLHYTFDEEKLLEKSIDKYTNLEDLIIDSILLDVNSTAEESGTITYQKINDNWEEYTIINKKNHPNQLEINGKIIDKFEFVEFSLLNWYFYRYKTEQNKWNYITLNTYKIDFSVKIYFEENKPISQVNFFKKLQKVTKTYLK